ncbi:hypothetical protein E4U52_004793 [Claviceps spartinae]|nr:hypothetical protein E4U52_004793 [Claviceps spartinae]
MTGQPEASSSQDTSSGLSSCLQLSSPPPPTATEKGKGKSKAAKLIGDVYDVYLTLRSINSCVRKPRLPKQERSFCYQDDMFVKASSGLGPCHSTLHGYDTLTNRCDGSKKRLREDADETEDAFNVSTDVQGGSQPTREQRFR